MALLSVCVMCVCGYKKKNKANNKLVLLIELLYI